MAELESVMGLTVPGGATVFVGKTTVYGPAASPVIWTDLDLSGFSALGTNLAFVILAFYSASNMVATAVRAKGDASQYYDAAAEASAYGCALGHHDLDAVLVLATTTNSSGVCQWITEATQTATVYMLSYVR